MTVHELSVTLVPDHFRFADRNPASGLPYAASRYADLPPFAIREVPVGAEQWDALVLHGEVDYLVDPLTWFSLAHVHRSATVRQWMTPPSAPTVCGDCWGTGVVTDVDGSCTGRRGTVIWCWCCDTVPAPRSAPEQATAASAEVAA